MRAKPIVILLLVAGAAALVIVPTVRKNRAESAVNERKANDIAIGAYYDKNVAPLLSAPAGEPDHIVGKLLPIVVRKDIRVVNVHEYQGTALDPVFYEQLDPAQRTDRLADAGTLVFVGAGAEVGYGTGPYPTVQLASISKGVVLTLFDPATKSVIGRKTLEGLEPPTDTDRRGLDSYTARQAARAAVYLKTLPRR